MRSLRWGVIRVLALGCLLGFAAPLFAQDSPAGKSTATHSKKKSRKKVSSRRGQQKIDAQRAREIQEAWIREHYLEGKVTGVWDDASQRAMQKYQADNGWQSKTTPDSRALIKLGLGPDHEHLLNPESAMTSGSAAPPPPAPVSPQPQR